MARTHRLPLPARRSFRLALATAMALVAAYGLSMPLPFISPLLAVILGAGAQRPPGLKQTPVLLLVLALMLGIGVLLGPLLQKAPVPALLLIGLGLYFSSQLAIVGGKDAPATLLALGLTVIPAASTVSQALASAIITALVAGMALAIASLWLAYLLFPEDDAPVSTATAGAQTPQSLLAQDGHWRSLRATLIILPPFLLTLTNPAMYLPLTVKSILLGREASAIKLHNATRELIGSTAFGGLCAVVLWSCLSLAVELWFYGAWILFFALLMSARAYGALPSRFGPGFWINTLTTVLILLGAAVQDSANGKDVYQAFAVRMALFLLVAVYAVFALSLLEWWRERRQISPNKELARSC